MADGDAYLNVMNPNDRKSSQGHLLRESDWRQGPRETIVSLVGSDTLIVIEMEDSVVETFAEACEEGSQINNCMQPTRKQHRCHPQS